jgi:hypothetical protein
MYTLANECTQNELYILGSVEHYGYISNITSLKHRDPLVPLKGYLVTRHVTQAHKY